MEAIQYNAALRIMTASAEIRFGGSSTTTLVYKTLLFLQKKKQTKITVSEVPLFNNFYTQYVIQNKSVQWDFSS